MSKLLESEQLSESQRRTFRLLMLGGSLLGRVLPADGAEDFSSSDESKSVEEEDEDLNHSQKLKG